MIARRVHDSFVNDAHVWALSVWTILDGACASHTLNTAPTIMSVQCVTEKNPAVSAPSG